MVARTLGSLGQSSLIASPPDFEAPQSCSSPAVRQKGFTPF